MRKLLSLIAMLISSFSIPIWADSVMPFEAASSATDPDAQMYYIYQPGNERYVKVSGGNILGNSFSGDQFIFVNSGTDGLYYIYDKSCKKFIKYTRTTDPGNSVTQTSQSAVQLVDAQSDANTWRIVLEPNAQTVDIFPGEATGATANSGTASWNFRGGPNNALNLYAANDSKSSWQIVAQLSAKLNCATRLYAEPGKKFMHKLVGNNKDDVQTVDNLPTGFTINEDRPDYKYITGTAPEAGEYTYTLNLKDGTTETVRLTVSDKLTQPRPFMGVLTWNAFQNHIDENVIIQLAEGFDKFALRDAGYEYMCIDDQWAQGSRDANGHLQWRTDKFPNYATLADRIHNMGLKIGIYSDAGTATCSSAQPGSYNNETTDAQDFVKWGFDLLKYDYCAVGGATSAAAAEERYGAMGRALEAAASAKNKDFLFYMCEWGYRSPWLWGANTGATCWRATDDTRDYWTHPNGGVLEVLNKMKGIWAYQGVNRWNDADMMCIGLHGSGYSSNNNSALGYGDGDSRCTGLTMAEQRSQMALWCMFASPLTHSNNITNLDGKPNELTGKRVTNPYFREDLAIILNKELIALDQDPLGQAGEPIYDEADYIVFQKDMEDGSIGLSITNLSGAEKTITVDFARLSALKSGVTYKMRDLWSHEYVGRDYTNAYQLTVKVPSHDTFVYRIQDVNDDDLTWEEPVIPGWENLGEPEPELLIDVTKKYRVYNYSRNNANYAWTAVGSEGKTYPLDNSRDDQVWQFEATGNADYPYYIKSVSTGKYMQAIGAGGGNVQLIDGTSGAGMYNATLKDGSTELYCFNSGTGTGNYLFTDTNNRLDGWKNGDYEYFYVVAIEEAETPEADWNEEAPQTSTIAEPILYRIHNLGKADGGKAGNNVYVQTQESGIRFCDANGDADEFVFIDGGNSTVYIYDYTTSKYISYTTDAEGSCGWSGGKAVNVVTRVEAVADQTSAKTWVLVADEETAGSYDIKPSTNSNNGWSFYGGVDQESVVLNLENKTNRNAKWRFERKGNATGIEPKYVTAPEIRDLAATGRFAILGVTTTGDHYINGEAGTGRVSTSSNLADARAPHDNEIVYFVSAGNDQYYIQREDNKKYIKATTSNLSLVESTSEATPFYILGKGEANYGDISGYDQLYADITEHPNDLMIRFKNGGNWLNTQGSTATGKLHSGTGAWSFEYVYYLGEQDSTPEEPVIDLGAYEGEITTKYPFVLSTSADDMHWHYLTIRGNKYVSYNANTQQFDNSTTAPSGDAGLFAFVPVSENGVKIINKAAGLTKALGGAITNNGKISTVNYADGLEFIYKNNEGHDVFGVVGNANAHVNDVQSHLGFWLDGASATDDGSTFTFTPIEVLVSTNDVKHYYTIRNANPDGDRDKTYAHYEAANQYLSLGTERNNKTVFYFTSAGDNANGSQLVHIHSYLAEDGLTMANFNEWNTSNKAWYVKLANGTAALTDFNIGFNADYSSSWNHQTGGVKSWSAGADKGSAWYIEEVFEKTYTLDLSAADVEGYTLYNNGQAYTDGQQITGFFFDAASFTTDEAGEHPFDGTLTTVDGTLVFGFEEFSNILAGTRPAGVSKYTLWYDEPSSKTTAADKWMDYGLPIGNGQVGAVLAGDLLNDEIQFNEKSLWRGDSRYNGDGGQGYYQNFGFINIKDLSGNFSIASTANPVKGYNRYLDIVNGVSGVNYSSETTHFERTFITSAPDRVFAAHYTADGDQKLHLKFAFTPDTEISAETPVYGEGGTASFGGKLATVSYNASFKVVSTDGQVTRTDDGIEVSGATDVTLYMAAGTNFDITSTSLVNGDRNTVKTRNEGLIAAAEQKGWAAILDGHKADFSEYMNRVDIQFGDAASEKNTKELIDLYATPANRSNADGLFLEQLYYTYGRYLAVAGNRINDTAVPTNLQGIWNKYSNSSFWHCDLHADINVEMNYWPMEAANLSEMHRPFLDHILGLSKEGYAWRDLAKRVKSDARGWTIGTENNIFGGRSNFADNLKTQSAWYCSHLWQHYQYTQDKDFLREAFPTMLSSLQFLMDISTLNTNDNTMEVLHEWSPEHGDGNQVTAYAQQCVAENIKEVLAAVDILGSDVISAEDLAEIVAFDKVADKGLNTETYNGKTCLKEWKYLPLSHNDPAGHRHLSHLMALYPFSLVSAYDTENGAIYDAAKNSLHVRNGGDVTGWSMGWKTNCYARTLEGDEAHNYLAAALRHVNNYKIAMAGAGGCYYNLWDAHSPFQIDGNFGVTAGVNEMLLQSYDGTIHLLPALPSAWADGHAKGLKAIGNFTVDQTWEGGKLTEATVTSVMGGELRVQYGEELLTMMTYPGESYNFYFNGDKFSSYLAGATIVNVVEHVNAALQGNGDLDDIEAAKNAVLGITGRK